MENGSRYSRIDQVKFEGCLPQILLDPFLNTLIQIRLYTGEVFIRMGFLSFEKNVLSY